MKDYSNLFKDTFNKILKERTQAQFVNKSLEKKIEDLYFDGHELLITDPFKVIYSEDFKCNFIYNFPINDVKIIIQKGDEFNFYKKLVSDIYCQQIAIVFEIVINLFLKIFKQFRIENNKDFQLFLKDYKLSKQKFKKSKFRFETKIIKPFSNKTFYEFKMIKGFKKESISIRNLNREINSEGLKSHQCLELLELYLSSEIKENNLRVLTNKFLSHNIFEFLTFMKDCRNSIIHNDNIIKRNQNIHFKNYFIIEDLENGSEKISLNFEKTKKILEDYSFVVYLIYCALNLKYKNEDVLKIVHHKY